MIFFYFCKCPFKVNEEYLPVAGLDNWTFQSPALYSMLSILKMSWVVKDSFHFQMFWAWAMILRMVFSASSPNFALNLSS